MMKRSAYLFFCLLSGVLLQAQNSATVYSYVIDGNIAQPALRKTQKALREAQSCSADYLLLELNTFGGEVAAAEGIRDLLMTAPMPAIVFINTNAASAGVLISIACDSIYMAPGSSIGAASVVDQNGQIMPDKYQSYMRSLMRATAETNGRDPDIAQAMVDPDICIKDVSEKGKVLTFTSEEAVRHHFCEGIADSREEVAEKAGIAPARFVEQKSTWIDKVIYFLTSPVVSGLLIMAIAGGVYFELQSPGIGLPLAVAVLGAILYFAPHYLEGLATHWEILLFIAGIILIALELFVIPGFGVAGVSGILLVAASLILAMVFNVGFTFRIDPSTDIGRSLAVSTLIVAVSLAAGFFVSLWAGKRLLTARTRFGTMALNTELETGKGFIAPDMAMRKYVGLTGTATTFMRPAGKIDIDGEIVTATAETGLIEKGEKVIVTRFENAQLFVRKQVAGS